MAVPKSRAADSTKVSPANAKKLVEGYKEMMFKDKGSFRGEWKNGVPHGFGTSCDPSCNVYIGTFFEGLPHGRGSHSWANGQRYEGEYQAGKQHGYGKWTHPSGDNYEGYWANDVRHGQGSYYSKAAKKAWFGEWKAGAQHKPLTGSMDAVRPVWATAFAKDERLYDEALYDKTGHYHPVNTYDEGNYLDESRNYRLASADPTYDFGETADTDDTPGYQDLPQRENDAVYDFGASEHTGDAIYDAAGRGQDDESIYDTGTTGQQVNYDLVGPGAPKAVAASTYDVVVQKKKP